MMLNKINDLWIKKGCFSEVYFKFPIISLLLIPSFYTFIIFPFYYKELDYLTFAFENIIFWLMVIFFTLVFSKALNLRKFKRTVYFSHEVGAVVILSYVLIVFTYIFLNVIKLGFNGLYSGCHYCGPEAIGGFGLLRIIIFDIGTIVVLLLPITIVVFKKNKWLVLIHFITSLLVVYYDIVGSYRNQILPMAFLIIMIFTSFFSARLRTIIYVFLLCLSPIAAISMAFFHYFKDGSGGITLFDYFSMNEFFSNYNNFIIYNDGFKLELPFYGASYFGPILHRLNGIIDTGFISSASQMARYVGDGIGYGFSPLLESLLNFGDFFFLGAFFISILVVLTMSLIKSAKNDLISIVYFSLFIFYLFNINRVDFTSSFNIYFHKLIFIWFFFYIIDRPYCER